MKYYQEITVLPNNGVGYHFVLQKIYEFIHLRLVKTQAVEKKSLIGISFPQYDLRRICLGKKLRLFCDDRERLQVFDVKELLKNFRDYLHITDIRPVPAINSYVRFKRRQIEPSLERLARRKAKRQGIALSEAEALLRERVTSLVQLPFIRINSHSTGQCFPLFIVKEDVGISINEGFNCYGLSAVSTVPEF